MGQSRLRAAGDALLLWAHTRTLAVPHEYEAVESEPTVVVARDLGGPLAASHFAAVRAKANPRAAAAAAAAGGTVTSGEGPTAKRPRVEGSSGTVSLSHAITARANQGDALSLPAVPAAPASATTPAAAAAAAPGALPPPASSVLVATNGPPRVPPPPPPSGDGSELIGPDEVVYRHVAKYGRFFVLGRLMDWFNLEVGASG